MAVEISNERKAFVLSYDLGEVEGVTANLRCTNPSDLSDVSTRDGFQNDGNVLVSFPMDYSGETEVVITGSDGGEETGTIEI